MLKQNNKSEIICILASLILYDNNIAISETNLKKIFAGAKVKTEDYWPLIFTKLMHSIDIYEFIGVSKKNKEFEIEEKIETVKKNSNETVSNETINPSKSKDSEEDVGFFDLFD